MLIYPNLYKKFECIGGACKNTCCAGWSIPIDSATLDYYLQLDTDFGAFIRENLYEENDMALVRLTSEGRCPFLTKDDLCQVYQNCGPEHMSQTCQRFPRSHIIKGKNDLNSLSLSCEAVLQLLQSSAEPIRICVEGSTDLDSMNDVDISAYEQAQFIAWGTELLQEPSIPLGISLGTALYMGMEVEPDFKKHDYLRFEKSLLAAESIQREFELAKESLGKEELTNSAWQFIFQVIDIFYATLQQTSLPQAIVLQCQESMALLSDSARREYIHLSYLKHRAFRNEEQHLHFMRRLASLLFCEQSLHIDIRNGEQIFLQNTGSFILLAEILPSICATTKEGNPEDFFPELVNLSRLFQQSQIISDYIYPTIKEQLSPDALTYALAFMALFDE